MQRDVVSLEIAKRLKEAGWAQEAQHYYCTDIGEQTYSQCCAIEFKKATCGHHIAMPTIGELLEALPKGIALKSYTGEYQTEILGGSFFNTMNGKRVYANGRSENPADALALLWMALKEKGII